MKTLYVNPSESAKKWYIIDADGKILGRVAERAAWILRGKHKASYVPYHDLGDQVIVINAEKARLSGLKYKEKIYYRHSGYPGGIFAETYDKLVARKSCSPMEKAIKGMLPKGALGREIFRNLRVYKDEQHPHDGQSPIIVDLDKKKN